MISISTPGARTLPTVVRTGYGDGMLGGNLHRSTDAMDEAGARISKYLLMQLVVNTTYGIPIALGLWVIGVPGALLWGTVAAVMRFIPYVGPAISAIFPVALAFAIDPGWHMPSVPERTSGRCIISRPAMPPGANITMPMKMMPK